MDGTGKQIKAYICEEYFELGRMREKNKESIYLDGIEDVKNGVLIYTDELVDKVKSAFGVVLRKKVSLDELDDMCDFLIHEIIEQQI